MQLNYEHSAQDPVAPNCAVQGEGTRWETLVAREWPSRASGVKSRETRDPEILYPTVVVTTSLVPMDRWVTRAARPALPTPAPAGRPEEELHQRSLGTGQDRTLCPLCHSSERHQLC